MRSRWLRPAVSAVYGSRITDLEGQFDELEWNARGNLGLALVDAGDFENGLKSLKAVYKYYRKNRTHSLEGHALFNIAYAYYKMGDLVSAHREGARANELLALISDREAEDAREQIASCPSPSNTKRSLSLPPNVIARQQASSPAETPNLHYPCLDCQPLQISLFTRDQIKLKYHVYS